MVCKSFFAFSKRTHVLVTGTRGRGRETALRVWEATLEGGGPPWLGRLMRFLGSVWIPYVGVACPVWTDHTVEHLAKHCFYGPFLGLVTILLEPQTVLILMMIHTRFLWMFPHGVKTPHMFQAP